MGGAGEGIGRGTASSGGGRFELRVLYERVLGTGSNLLFLACAFSREQTSVFWIMP